MLLNGVSHVDVDLLLQVITKRLAFHLPQPHDYVCHEDVDAQLQRTLGSLQSLPSDVNHEDVDSLLAKTCRSVHLLVPPNGVNHVDVDSLLQIIT